MSYRLEVLKQELADLEASIRDHDSHRYLVKGWAISAATVLAGFAAQGRRPAIAFVGAGAVLGFWLLEAYIKAVQRIFIMGKSTIKRFLTDELPAVIAANDLSALPDLRLADTKVGRLGHAYAQMARESIKFQVLYIYGALFVTMVVLGVVV